MTPHAAAAALSAALPHAGVNTAAAIIARVLVERHGAGGARRFIAHLVAHVEQEATHG